MKTSYFNLIDQTYYFPQEGFDIHKDKLSFHGISLTYLIEKYGTPFKLTYLPRIGDQIKRAKNLFKRSMRANNYDGNYYYCYCTKCCHFNHVISEALKYDVHIETSSAFDIDLIYGLYHEQKITKDTILIHNGYKSEDYLNKIVQLYNDGFTNCIVVLDSKRELKHLDRLLEGKVKIGIRMAIDEEPQSAYYTSRLGINPNDILDFYANHIKTNPKFDLVMMHFFVDTGIKDSLYYWGEFKKAMNTFAMLKKACPEMNGLNIGGGLPIRNNLGFEYDYKYMINEIVKNIKEVCDAESISEPDLYTEFGKYTVGESGATIFTVLDQKQQNDSETWYMIDNSLINTIPDAWGINERFILLPVNKWDRDYTRVNIGGVSCDHSDYYNTEDFNQQVFLPIIDDEESTPLYVGFFHTGAYQDAISGYGGIKHCLIPSPKIVIVNRDEKGNYVDYLFREEQRPDDMLNILGFNGK